MIKRAIIASVASAAVLGSGVAALAASGTPAATPAATANFDTGCVTSTHTLAHLYKGSHSCDRGQVKFTWNITGPKGPAGPQGPPGPSAILSVSAQTVVSNWPENSGWATDNFNRTVTITREHAAPASKCGAAATRCYFYTETLGDNGTFTTTDGHASPNGSSTATIKGVWTGSIVGGGKLEFYADSASPNPSLVPGTANGSAKPSTTTDWYKLFFPGGTNFGLTTGANVPWTTYDWTYKVSVTCGTNNSVPENWNDGINPGDDGQGAADGNITGATACTS